MTGSDQEDGDSRLAHTLCGPRSKAHVFIPRVKENEQLADDHFNEKPGPCGKVSRVLSGYRRSNKKLKSSHQDHRLCPVTIAGSHSIALESFAAVRLAFTSEGYGSIGPSNHLI
jgi:hypothetical protein